MRLVVFAIFCLVILPAAVAAEAQEESVARVSQGAQIEKNVYKAIPEERKIYRVASNVIRAEEKDAYLERRLDQMEARMTAFEERLAGFEKALDELDRSRRVS